MRFSVTFCALLLVTTTGIARANSNKPVKPAGNNQADSAENANAALATTGGYWRYIGFFLEKGEDGTGVGMSGKTANKYNIRQTTDPKNPGRVAQTDFDDQFFVGTPKGNSQSVMVSSRGVRQNEATFVSLNPVTGKLISFTYCYTYDKDYKFSKDNWRCYTVTRKTCDAIFPESHLRSQKLEKIRECGKLLEEMESVRKLDPSVESENVARMKSIHPELRLTANQDVSSDSIGRVALYYNELSRVIPLCHSAEGVERFEKVSNPLFGASKPGQAEEAK